MSSQSLGSLSSRHIGFLEAFLRGVRDLYVAVQRLAVQQVDVVLDGLLAPDDMVDKIISLLPVAPESTKSHGT